MKLIYLFVFLTLTSFKLQAIKERWDQNKDGWSPLMLAIYNFNEDSIRLLIIQNVDLNYVTSVRNSFFYLTATEVAVRAGNASALAYLLATGKIRNPQQYFPLACSGKSAEIVELLLPYGQQPNDTISKDYTYLMLAAQLGSFEVFKHLIYRGGDIYKRRSGQTLLMFAAWGCDLKKVELLLSLGMDKDLEDDNGHTAYNYLSFYYFDKVISSENKELLCNLLKPD